MSRNARQVPEDILPLQPTQHQRARIIDSAEDVTTVGTYPPGRLTSAGACAIHTQDGLLRKPLSRCQRGMPTSGRNSSHTLRVGRSPSCKTAAGPARRSAGTKALPAPLRAGRRLFHLYLPPRPTATGARQTVRRRQTWRGSRPGFPTPAHRRGSIMDTFPIVRRKDRRSRRRLPHQARHPRHLRRPRRVHAHWPALPDPPRPAAMTRAVAIRLAAMPQYGHDGAAGTGAHAIRLCSCLSCTSTETRESPGEMEIILLVNSVPE